MEFLKPFVVRQVEQLPHTIFTLWDWLPVILQVLVAVFVIKTVAKWFSREYRDIPKLNVKVPSIKGTPLKVQGKFQFDPKEITCYNPASMEILGETHVHTKEEVYDMVKRAKAAQKVWSKTDFPERRRVLRTLLQFVVENQEDFIEVSVKETGKTRVEAAFGEIFVTCDKIKYLCSSSGEGALAREYRNSGIMMHKSAYIDYVPYGTIGIIIPWNFPLHNAISHIATALFTGNAAIVKVSEWASWSVHYLNNMFKELLRATGHSTDLVQFVTGYAESGSAVVSSVDKVFFIGSPQVGRKVMEGCSPNLTPVTLELGGKDPFIVCEDADIGYTVDIGLRAAFFNCGQNCLSAERFYVYEGIYEKFLQRVKEGTAKMKQGVNGPDIGAVNMPLQLDKYREFIDDAVKKGAKILAGGKLSSGLKGHFFEPTILVDVNHSMKIMQEETFGPVMAIMKVKSDEEVVKLANESQYGLSCSIFSANYKRAHAIAEKIQSGGTVINDWGLAFMCTDLPFGGVKISGFGKFNGKEGIRDFCFQKTCVTDKYGIIIPPPKAVLSLPTSPNSYKLVLDAVPILYDNSLLGRASAVVRIAKRILSGNF